jgi:hypothetical protein
MIKATATLPDGKTLLVIGLSFGNLDKFRAAPGDTFIRIDGKQMGLPVDVLIFSGETEAHMQTMMAGMIGPDTEVHIDPKLKP